MVHVIARKKRRREEENVCICTRVYLYITRRVSAYASMYTPKPCKIIHQNDYTYNNKSESPHVYITLHSEQLFEGISLVYDWFVSMRVERGGERKRMYVYIHIYIYIYN